MTHKLLSKAENRQAKRNIVTHIAAKTAIAGTAMCMAMAFTACQKSSSTSPVDDVHPTAINISATPQANKTRATDTAFDNGDQVGLYVVNRDGDKAQTLLTTGNYVDNMRFTYSGTWTPDKTIYWKDQQTRADMYLYYPYTASMTDVNHWSVEVPADQTTEANYRKTDVLVGSKTNIAPTEEAVHISARHVMSRMEVTVAPGKGFTEEQLKAANIQVAINGTRTHASVDIATGKVTAADNTTSSIQTLRDGLTFRATLMPQTVAEGQLFTILVNGDRYTLQRGITLESGTSHHATVTVNKSNGSFSIDITGWNTDSTDYGGYAE